MASTEDRLRTMIAENLEVDGKPVDSNMALDSSFGDQGVSSMDIVSFGRLIETEFNIKFRCGAVRRASKSETTDRIY